MSLYPWNADERGDFAPGRPAHPDRLRAGLGALSRKRAELDAEERRLIHAARDEGLPWRVIGVALGLDTPQGAWQRAKRLGVDRENAGQRSPDPRIAVGSVRTSGEGVVVASQKPEHQADGVRPRVEQALIELLRSGENFSTISVGKILVDAGVARSTFYAHFGDKLAVLLLLGRQALGCVIEESEEWSGLPDRAGRDELRGAVGRIVRCYHDNAPVLAAMTESAAADPRTRSVMRNALHDARAAITEHAASQQSVGAIRVDVDVPVTMQWLLAMLEHGLYQHVRVAQKAELDRHIDALSDMIWCTLYQGAPSRP